MHVLTGDLMTRAMTHFHPRLRRGDAFLHNSPYHGSTHAADHTILIPVIDDDGVHRLTVLAKAHQADCGNAEPTTYSAEARDVYEEGALIFPCVRIQQDFEDIEDIIRVCKLRIRVPEQWWGDYLALLGSARSASNGCSSSAPRSGWDAVEEVRARVVRLQRGADGRRDPRAPERPRRRNEHARPFPGVPDGVPVTATVDVRSEDAIVEVDLRDNIDAVRAA